MIQIRFHSFDTVDSTNDTALEMARAGEPEGTVVIARRQLKGKGRRGRGWWDTPGQSVLMSAILIPPISQNEIPRLSFVASLAAADLLKAKCELVVSLKWPNDVLVRGKKIAGVLVETTTAPMGTAAIIGIGMNVNQSEFPTEISDSATSVILETGVRHNVDDLAAELAQSLFTNYEAFLASGFEEILARWKNYMHGRGAQAEVVAEGRTLRGVIEGVDPAGALIVRDAGGQIVLVHAAEELAIHGGLPDSEIRH